MRRRLSIFLIVLILGFLTAFVNNLAFTLMPYYQKKNSSLPSNATYTPLPVKGANSLNYDLALFSSLSNKLFHHGYRLLFSDAYLFEHKDDPYIEGAVAYNVLALFLKFFDGDIDRAWIAINYTFSFLCYLFIFMMGRAFGLPVWISLSLPFAMMFLTTPTSLLRAEGVYPLKDFNRYPKISFSFILLSSYLIAMHLLLSTQKKKWMLCIIVLLTLCVYDYFYYWSTLIGATGLLFLASLFLSRPTKEKKSLLCTLVCVAILSAPLLLHIYYFIKHPEYQFLKESKDQVVNGVGLPPTFAAATLGLLFISSLKRIRSAKDVYSTVAPLATTYLSCLFLMHAWVFKLPQMTRYHYSTTVMRPLLMLVAALCVYEVYLFTINQWPKHKFTIKAMFVVASVGVAITFLRYPLLNNWRYSEYNHKNFIYEQPIRQAVDWIKQSNLTENDVALTVSSELNFIFAMRTPFYQFIPGFHMSMAGFKERWERMLIGFAIFNVDRERLKEFLDEQGALDRYFSGYSSPHLVPEGAQFEKAFFAIQPFHNYYYFSETNVTVQKLRANITVKEISENSSLGSYVPLAHRKLVMEMYDQILNLPAQRLLSTYKLDYIVEYNDKHQIAQRIGDQFTPLLNKVFSNEKITIWKVK